MKTNNGTMNKKEYIEPQMEAVNIQQAQMLCTSPGASTLSNTEGFIWTNDLDGDDN